MFMYLFSSLIKKVVFLFSFTLLSTMICSFLVDLNPVVFIWTKLFYLILVGGWSFGWLYRTDKRDIDFSFISADIKGRPYIIAFGFLPAESEAFWITFSASYQIKAILTIFSSGTSQTCILHFVCHWFGFCSESNIVVMFIWLL